ncbi:MAG: hypothetical protein LQ350_004545 [Teloschistes chrysophthalmus]|nr:MAG: hypothetical protein LQ350_004545 [Niorma chrysophthalma]
MVDPLGSDKPMDPANTPTSPKPSYNPHNVHLSTPSLAKSQPTTPPVIEEEEETYDPTSTDPFSPFYCHTRASESRCSRLNSRSQSRSQSYTHSRSQSYTHTSPSNRQQPPPEYREKDLEKGINITTNPVAAKSNTSLPPTRPKLCNKNQQSLLCKSEAKKEGGWWRKMSKRRKLVVQAALAVLIVGAVTGLGIGVSKAMGTGVWKNNNTASSGIGEHS